MTRSTKHLYLVYAVLLGLVVFSYALMYGPQPMFSSIAATFAVSQAAVGLLITVFMLALCIAPLCVGLLIATVGVRRAVAWASALLGVSGLLLFCVSSYPQLVLLRVVQGCLMPIVLTSAMTLIAYLFRHFDLRRAMAGFVTATLVGSLSGRILGGFGAELIGWRWTLALFCFLFFVVLAIVPKIPSPKIHGTIGTFAAYRRVLAVPGIPALLCIEACGIFTFAALGNVLPLRMAEISAHSTEGSIGLMYLGYSVGLIASLTLAPLRTFLGSTKRLLVAGALIYVLSLLSLLPANVVVLFFGLWCVAFGEFLVHSIAPGLINGLAAHSCDRSAINGLFLACYYLGGVAGSMLPAFCYASLGWGAAMSCMFAVQMLALVLVLWVVRHVPVD